MRTLLFLLALAATPAARAQDATDAYAANAYASGAFIEAANRAEGAGDPGNLSLAARAILAEAITAQGIDLDALVARAESDARKALAAAPDSVDARLNLALALGVKGRRASIADALRHGYAREGRDLLAQARARAPDDAWAQALTGAWHLEIVRRGGRAGAAYFGASTRAGIAAFERAHTLAPDDAAIAYQYAVALLELDPAAYADKAAVLLSDAGGCATQDAFERRMKAQAARIAVVLATRGGAEAARTATARFH